MTRNISTFVLRLLF